MKTPCQVELHAPTHRLLSKANLGLIFKVSKKAK